MNWHLQWDSAHDDFFCSRLTDSGTTNNASKVWQVTQSLAAESVIKTN
jgi:hypothetical protein